MGAIKNFFGDIDFAELKKQKLTLLTVISYMETNVPLLVDDLNGILNLIDGIQDHAVDVLGYDENLVFNLSNDDSDFSQIEIDEFKERWGQEEEEICSELGYEYGNDGISELLMSDGYFWDDESCQWFPRSSSMYSEKEQKIADFIRN